MKIARLWNGILAAVTAAVLALPVSAVGGSEKAPAYDLAQRGSGFPIPVQGTISELREDSLLLECKSADGESRDYVVTVTADTWILEADTGTSAEISALKEGETLRAWVGPAMSNSQPPVTVAAVLLRNPDARSQGPVYGEVQSVTRTAKGTDVSMTGGVLLHLKADVTILPAPGETDAASLADVKPGSRLLSWYSEMTDGEPSQAEPHKVMLFPYTYQGWAAAKGLDVALNGKWMKLSGDSAPRVKANRLMVPVRALAEELGCAVSWEPYTNRVTVSREGEELYRFIIGEDRAQKGTVTVGLLVKTHADKGVTLMALDDFMSLQGLKLEIGLD